MWFFTLLLIESRGHTWRAGRAWLRAIKVKWVAFLEVLGVLNKISDWYLCHFPIPMCNHGIADVLTLEALVDSIIWIPLLECFLQFP